MNNRYLKKTFFIALFNLVFVMASMGQANLANVTGKVTDASGLLPGATIIIKNESTGFTIKTTTNEKGVFFFKELPLGSPYSITAAMVGMATQKQTGYTLNQGDVLHVDFKLTGKTEELQMVEVKASSTSLRNKIENIGSSTAITPKDIARLPVNGRNFTSLTDLSPLSSGSGGSLSGQLGSATNYTIDGMSARGTISGGLPTGAYSISMEAIREFQVVTNQYDVTYGNAGGGTISTVTKSGTNDFSGSVFTYARANWLTSPYGLNGAKRTQDFSTYQYGFSLGGPIVKDKAHFFIVWDHQADSRPFTIANIQGADDEKRNNVTQTTLDNYLSIARAKYGVANTPQFGQFGKKKNTHAAFARIDWQINSKNLFTIRNNFIYDYDNLSDGDNTAINIYEVYSSRKSINNSLMASLRTVVTPNLTNELKLQYYWEYNKLFANDELPADNIPRATVMGVSSAVAGGTKPYSTDIQLGGQRYGGDYFNNNSVQLTDNLYWTKGKYNFTFGGGITFTNQNTIYGSEVNGRFYFDGLTNFDNLKPSRFTREVYLSPDRNVKFNILAPNIYAQVETKLLPGLSLTAGLRLDYTTYLDHANFNEVVYRTLGLNTANKLSSLQIQPRVQATWDVAQNGKNIIRLGGGILGSALNPYSMINNMVFDGSRILSVDLTGASVPTPNFPSYRQNPASAPGLDLISNPAIPKMATINMNGKDAKVPLVYKANASYSHFFSRNFRITLAGYLSLGRHNYMYLDKNMVDDPYFRIAAEDNRGVYVPANTIDAKGNVDWTKGRKTTEVGRVLQLESVGKVNQMAFVVDADYKYFKDGEISFSYTWNQTKDNTSYNGNVANSATRSLFVKDNPRDLSQMSYSDNHFRNKIVFYGSSPTFYGFSVGVRFSGIGGSRYSLTVNGNVNGDFVDMNDLAYVYDPNAATTPQAIKDGINAILNNDLVEPSAKEYITKSFGKMAERNGGINPFFGVFDLRILKKIKTYKKQYLELSADLFNVANLLNKNKGVNHSLGATQLYKIASFNPATNQYGYTVRTNAGVSALSGNTYQFQLGLRYGF
ncbi:TonB-dependent receptor [Pedobacter nototheniae]|uniref:TonB-dependent receptor n=1 Tax=Pedobacter nototheniae TaxID=2488994 RepID=UPI00103DEAD0|nr:carboxypeptidase regulatory-like domain-containing protein [Pedobacter nototheniae]